MREQDWAHKISIKIMESSSNDFTDDDLSIHDKEIVINKIAQALKQEREIATLEIENKYKKIVWPSDEEKVDWLSSQIIGMPKEIAKAFGLSAKIGIDWLKEWVESRRK